MEALDTGIAIAIGSSAVERKGVRAISGICRLEPYKRKEESEKVLVSPCRRAEEKSRALLQNQRLRKGTF